MKGADVLLFCAIPELSGWYSGKFLEYLGSGTPVLVCPPDEDVLIEAIATTGAGLIASTPEEVVVQLQRVVDGELPVRDEGVIEGYGRQPQVRGLAEVLLYASARYTNM